MTKAHKIYKIGKSYVILNINADVHRSKFRVDARYALQEQILRKLGLTPLFTFHTMGGTYHMRGLMNARKYFADNKFAKLYRVADGVELKVQKIKKEIRRERARGIKEGGVI